jgi:hypothetical protein
MEPVLIVGAAAIVIVMIIVAAVRIEKKRTSVLKERAMQRGFQFLEKTEMTLPGQDQLHLFNLGHSRRISNIMQKSGMNGDEMIFDYTYVTGHGKNRSVHRQTVFFFHASRLKLPVFEVRPENVFHKIGQVFGYQDIDFEEAPEFSKYYVLRGKDEESIKHFFNREIIAAFEKNKKISVEGAESSLIVYRSGKRPGPEEIFDAYEQAVRIQAVFQQRSDFAG